MIDIVRNDRTDRKADELMEGEDGEYSISTNDSLECILTEVGMIIRSNHIGIPATRTPPVC